MTLLCMRCAGTNCACGRLAWLNFAAQSAKPMAPADGPPENRLTEADDYFVLQPKEG
jgi:hypothetical protein